MWSSSGGPYQIGQDALSESDLDDLSRNQKDVVEKLIRYILSNKGQTLKALRKDLEVNSDGSLGTDTIKDGFNDLLDAWKPYGSFDKFPKLTDLNRSIACGLKELVYSMHTPSTDAFSDLRNEFTNQENDLFHAMRLIVARLVFK